MYPCLLSITQGAQQKANLDMETRLTSRYLPTIKETFEGLIPAHYETLKKIAEKYQIPYTGEHRKENYLAIHEVYDRYCTGESPD